MHNYNPAHQEVGSSDRPGYDDYRAIGQLTNYAEPTGNNREQRNRTVGLSLNDQSSGRDRVLRPFQQTDSQATQSLDQQTTQSPVENMWR